MKLTHKAIYTSVLISLLSVSYVYASIESTHLQHQSNNLKYVKYKQININEIFTIEQKTSNEESEFFKSDIKYPYLKVKKQYENKGDTHTKILDNINNQISNTVMSFKEEIKKGSESYKKMYESEPNKDQYVKYQYEDYTDYKVSYNKNNILSIPVTMYQFTGGAHGLTDIKSFNYDLSTGKELKLKDLFKENSNYKEVINKHIKDEISKNSGVYFIGKDAFKGISENQNFYIEDGGIVIYFSLYDIAPYSTGIPKFVITWDEIIDYLENPNISR